MADVGRFLRELLVYIDAKYPELGKSMLTDKGITDEVRSNLNQALAAFKDGAFQPTLAAK